MPTPCLRPQACPRLCIMTTVLLLACLTAVAGSGHASEWKGRAMLAVDYQGWSDLDNPSGEFDVLHPSVNVLASRRLGDESPWSFSIASEYRAFEYRFDGLDAGDAWDDIHVFRAAPRLRYALDEQWGIFGGAVGEFSGEGGSRFADAIRGGILVGGDWRPNDRFFVGLGVLAISALGDEALIQPIILITWNITDALTFTTQSWTSRGGRAKFNYAFEGGWQLSVAAGRERERFRLDKRLPGVGDGVGEKNSFPVTFTVAKTLESGITVEAFGGPVLGGELRVEDQNGNNVAVSDFERSWYVGAAVKLPF